jgi:hypothetical protein
MSNVPDFLGSYDDPEIGLLIESRRVLRKNLTELIYQYDSAELDWNSSTRQAIASEITISANTIINITNYIEDISGYEEDDFE